MIEKTPRLLIVGRASVLETCDYDVVIGGAAGRRVHHEACRCIAGVGYRGDRRRSPYRSARSVDDGDGHVRPEIAAKIVGAVHSDCRAVHGAHESHTPRTRAEHYAVHKLDV